MRLGDNYCLLGQQEIIRSGVGGLCMSVCTIGVVYVCMSACADIGLRMSVCPDSCSRTFQNIRGCMHLYSFSFLTHGLTAQ